MKRTFEIEFPDDLGPMWMNSDNLSTCLFSKEHIGGTLSARDFIITDMTDPENPIRSFNSPPHIKRKGAPSGLELPKINDLTGRAYGNHDPSKEGKS